MDIYAQNIMDHYKNPRNFGRIDDPTASRHEANPLCGDVLDIDVRVEGGVVKKIGFSGEGCAISQAAMSIVGEALTGKKVGEALALGESDVLKLLGVSVTERRKRCALLGLLGIQNILLAAEGKPEKKWSEILGG